MRLDKVTTFFEWMELIADLQNGLVVIEDGSGIWPGNAGWVLRIESDMIYGVVLRLILLRERMDLKVEFLRAKGFRQLL